MKGTNRSLDFLRGHEEIDENAHRTKGACPICFKRLVDYLEKEIEVADDEKKVL